MRETIRIESVEDVATGSLGAELVGLEDLSAPFLEDRLLGLSSLWKTRDPER